MVYYTKVQIIHSYSILLVDLRLVTLVHNMHNDVQEREPKRGDYLNVISIVDPLLRSRLIEDSRDNLLFKWDSKVTILTQ